ncbi:hypothetical protein BH688_04795 [Kushneria phosphatilytica]|nr:hypothetical protein BH688_04795 [Kushneria phosphatilytica]
MGWRLPQLADGPLLILAPHPDDAEIAAYGLYRHFHEQVWIITLTPGERLPRLDRQYLQGLDDDLSKATRRKGELRSWNAATTPMLAGVPIQQHVMLGHFNRHLNEMLATPEHSFSHPVVAGLTPDHFRCHNQLSLPTDSRAACRGYDLMEELEFLLGHIQPTTIVLPDPLLDPHPDHIATGHALRHAISRQGTAPQRLLSYTNHLRGTTLFPYGPAGARTSLPPANLVDQPAGGYFSFSLSPELQREKTTALMTMSDLQAPVSLERQLKRRLKDRLLHQHWRDPARHAYFRTAIKHNEVFRLFGRIEELVPEHQKV